MSFYIEKFLTNTLTRVVLVSGVAIILPLFSSCLL